jgi:hypothetical protein
MPRARGPQSGGNIRSNSNYAGTWRRFSLRQIILSTWASELNRADHLDGCSDRPTQPVLSRHPVTDRIVQKSLAR